MVRDVSQVEVIHSQVRLDGQADSLVNGADLETILDIGFIVIALGES